MLACHRDSQCGLGYAYRLCLFLASRASETQASVYCVSLAPFAKNGHNL